MLNNGRVVRGRGGGGQDRGGASRMIVQVLKDLFSRSILAEAKSEEKEKSPSVKLKCVKLLQELSDCMTSENLRPKNLVCSILLCARAPLDTM